MPQQTKKNRVVVALSILALCAGCAAPPSGSGRQQSSASECDPAGAALLGAIAGALIAKGNNRVRGAATGAAITTALCVGINYNTRQVKSAQQVNLEYGRRTGSPPPAEPTITAFEANFRPSDRVHAGRQVDMSSYIEVAHGRSQGIRVEQEVTLFQPDGGQLANSRKLANPGGSVGGFSTDFRLTLPEGIPKGAYTVRSRVYLDGRVGNSTDRTLWIV